MTTTTTTDARELQRRLDVLTRDLREAQVWIVHVGAQRVGLTDDYPPNSLAEFDTWVDELLRATLTRGERDQVDEGVTAGWRFDPPRVACPLCGTSPDTATGFTVPEGLRRHLHRTRYGTRDSCPVMDALRALRATTTKGTD